MRDHRGYVRRLNVVVRLSFDPEPILVPDGSIMADRLVVGITIVVPNAKLERPPRIFPFVPSAKIVTCSASGESAIVATEDVYPTLILTYFTVSRSSGRCPNPAEVVVVAVDLQDLLKLC